jgi:hypothetical protein
MAQSEPSLTSELRPHCRCEFEVEGDLSTVETFVAPISEIGYWLTG